MSNKKPLRFSTLLCTFTVLLLCASSNLVYGFEVTTTQLDGSGPEVHWSTPNADFYINTAGFPSGSAQAIQAAMQTWTNVPTSNFSFAYRGQTASTSYGENDGANIISFGSFGPGEESTLALNTFWFTTQGQMLDSDIKFNNSFAWSTNTPASAYDVQTVAVHELGHALSLKDLKADGDETKVMYWSMSAGQIQRALSQDDKDGITYLYSAGSNTSSTTTTIIPVPITSCPAETVLGPDHPYLEQLRAFRDGFLSRSAVGRRTIQMYYRHADSINAALERRPALRAATRRFFETAALLMASKQ